VLTDSSPAMPEVLEGAGEFITVEVFFWNFHLYIQACCSLDE
jgi:hypothetical protein